MNKNESYFEDIMKGYSSKDLIKEFNNGNIISLIEPTENRITPDKFNLLVLEDELNIVFFKSFISDKFLLLRGVNKLKSLLGFPEDILDKFNWRIKVQIIYGMKEREDPTEFYKRIETIYGVSVEEFLKISKEDGSNG